MREKRVTVSRVIRVEPFELLHSRNRATGFGDFLAGVWSPFDPVLSHNACFPAFWNGGVSSMPLYVGSM